MYNFKHMTRTPLKERFFNRFIPEPNSGCWLWLGSGHRDGYGKIHNKGKGHLAHRVSYEMHHGPIKAGNVVMHKCNNKCCVNPDHLKQGTQRENIADAAADGLMRSNPPKGEASPQAKLTERSVLAIRASKATNKELALAYGVSQCLISNVRNRKTWRHL